MAASNPTDLANLMESVSVASTDSAAQDALTNLLGIEIPLDAGFDGAAGFIATKLGLQPKNSMVQTGVFVLTKAAILETASLLGVGAGLAKLDLISFKVAQLKKQVEAIDKKLDVILSTPLKLAVDFFGKAMRRMESENISGTIKEMEKVRDHAMQAFRYVEGQGATTENIGRAVVAKKFIVMSEVLIEAFDNSKIVPFSLLTKEKKQTIGNLIEDEINGMQTFFDSNTMSMLTFNKEEKAKKRQDLMDGLLRSAYPFISEGRGLTNSNTQLQLPYNLGVLPKYLPEGQEDSVSLVIGQLGGWPVTVKIWREGSQAFASYYTYYTELVSQSVDIAGKEEVTLPIGG